MWVYVWEALLNTCTGTLYYVWEFQVKMNTSTGNVVMCNVWGALLMMSTCLGTVVVLCHVWEAQLKVNTGRVHWSCCTMTGQVLWSLLCLGGLVEDDHLFRYCVWEAWLKMITCSKYCGHM